MARGSDDNTIKRTPDGARRTVRRSVARQANLASQPTEPSADANDQGSSAVQPGAPPGGPQDVATATLAAPSGLPATTPTSQRGRYQLLFELARGGMGTVYVGRLIGAHGFDRLVAIKQLLGDGAGEGEINAFLSEARVSSRLDHPNVVKTLELGEYAGAPFLVMELIEGVSLARLLQTLRDRDEVLDPHLATWIGVRIASGLHAAHELENAAGEPYNLVHRDVSPENVLLSYDGRVCVADFGVAKFSGAGRRTTEGGVVKGKFAYMSPEQTEALELDRRSDVFSLGIVLYECLTGVRVFDGRSVVDTVRRINSVAAPDPSQSDPEIPGELAALVLRCLAKKADDRVASSGQVANELREVLRSAVAIDESDLAGLLGDYFGEERDGLRERIRNAELGTTEGSAPSSKLDGAAIDGTPTHAAHGGQDSVTASITSGPPLHPRSFRGAWAVAGLAVLLGAIFWFTRSGDATTTTASGNAPGPSATATATAAASAGADAPAAKPVVPTPSAAPSATVTAATSATPQPLRPAAPAISREPPHAETTASAPPPNHKGVPFQTLDD